MLSKAGLADIIEWVEEFEMEGAGDANQTDAIHWELCVMDLVKPAWTKGFDYSLCLNQCNATFCPQPPADYLTAAKAEACAGQLGLQWGDVLSCVKDRGEQLRLASQQRFAPTHNRPTPLLHC